MGNGYPFPPKGEYPLYGWENGNTYVWVCAGKRKRKIYIKGKGKIRINAIRPYYGAFGARRIQGNVLRHLRIGMFTHKGDIRMHKGNALLYLHRRWIALPPNEVRKIHYEKCIVCMGCIECMKCLPPPVFPSYTHTIYALPPPKVDTYPSLPKGERCISHTP